MHQKYYVLLSRRYTKNSITEEKSTFMPIQHFPLETTNCTPSPLIRITNGTECKVLIAITVPTRNWKLHINTHLPTFVSMH
uniref:Uncharacterized protein n=1 Tax=Schistosoma haematobium TaxID=6185 RepID=A0A095C7X3_SCHHA